MKKKFQIKALNTAANKTGIISKTIAKSETATNKSNATTLYPIKPVAVKQAKEITVISNKLIAY